MRNLAVQNHRFPLLAKGQVWRTRAADIQILGVANDFIHYTVTTRMGRRRTTAQISGVEPMANYLRLAEARLLYVPPAENLLRTTRCRHSLPVRNWSRGRLWTKAIRQICHRRLA